MNVSDLKAGQGKVDVVVSVKSKEEPRVFNKYGRDLRVANAIVFDESGEIKMSLWNEDVDKIKVNDKIKVTNGYVSEFNGEKQLTSGKFGKLEVIESGGSAGSSADSSEDSGKEKAKGKKAKKEKAEEEMDEETPEEVAEAEEIEEEVM